MLAIGGIIMYILIKGLAITPQFSSAAIDSQPDRSPETTPAVTVYEDSGYNTAPY